MKKQFSLLTLLLLFTIGIGQMWGAEVFSWTVSSQLSKNTSQDATGGTVTCTGANMGSKFTPTGGPDYYKFSSSTVLTFTLSSGTFAVGDVISFTYTNASSGTQNVGVIIQETNPKTNVVSNVAKGNPDTQSYTVATSDGIAGQDHFSVMRGGTNSSNFAIRTVSVTRSGGDTPICPETLTISSKDSKTAFIEGDKIELTAALAKGNGTINYQWYKGSVAAGNAISGATSDKYEKSNCTTADAGDYFCVASKTSCDDITSSAFAITVAADPKCFNMPLITSKPADLASVTVTGGTLTDANAASKAIEFDTKGLKLGGSAARLKVTLSSASIVEGTKITVTYECTSDKGSGIAIYNGDYASKTMDESVSGKGSGSWEHTFTAAEAANYADEFMIDRNGGGGTMIVRAITVEDCGPAVVKHTITLNYNDGVTPNGSLKVVDGKAATQPTDPTRGKYTFLGWFVGDTDNAYVWSSTVTDDITLKAHWQDPWTISFDADGGSAVADITVKHNTKAEKPADPTKASHDFNGWYIGDTETQFDWDANVTQDYALKAHWLELVAKYDIEYYDGETKIGTEEQVRVDQHPAATGISTDKPLYTFVGWYTSSTLEGDPVDLNTVTPSEGLKIYGKWAKAYATSYDMEAYAVSEGASKAGLETALTAAGYAYTNINGIDYGHTHNYTYDGMKYKTNDGDLSFNVVADKVVEVKTGHLPSNDAVTMYINGVADATVFEGADESIETHKTNYFYNATEALYRLDVKASKGTCAVKAVTIRDPYQVTFDANEGDPVSAQYGHPSVTLPSASKGTDSFLGWFIGEDKIGEAGDSYTPTANVELVAHWEAISTDNTLSDLKVGGETVDGFDPAVHTYYVILPYGTENFPQISATAHSAKAKQVAIQQAVWTGEPYNCYRAQANVQAEDESWGYYDVRFSFAPKDGVSLVKIVPTSQTKGTQTGLYPNGDELTINLSSGMNLGGSGKYIGVKATENFQEGDVLHLDLNAKPNTTGSTQIILYAEKEATNEVWATGELASEAKDYYLTLPAAVNGHKELYVVRTDGNKWNGGPSVMEVTRAMNPMLTAMTIDGRTVTINEAAKTATVTIPYEADLENLTIAKTIIWNAPAATNSIVVNGGSAWTLGENTYKLTDKDGDATTYTITVARDVLKHTVSFNTHGGSAVASVEVEHNAYLTAVPNDPSKEDYLFQYWSLTDGGEEVDVTTVQINEDKEFHAVWVSDGGIKLLDGSTVNTTNFITAVTATETVEFKGNTVNYAKFSGTCGSVSNVKDLTRVIAYNATTNKTKIRISAHNNSTSARNILVKGLVEGADAAVDLATIALGNKEDKVSDWIEFDNAANRTIYIMVGSSAGDVYFTQVKVIESGETPMKQVGEVGYSLNFNKGRFFGVKDKTAVFEGMSVAVKSSDCQPLNTSVVKLASSSMSFDVAVPVTLTVTTNNSNTYYVSEGAAGTDNETAYKGASEFNLTAGTWYITAGASNVEITNIAFDLPKAEKPTITTQPATKLDFGAGDMTATVVATADGTLSYQWFNASDDSEVAGATEATLTTATEGTYYVVVTNSKAGYQDNTIKSDNAELKHRQLNDATLSALSYGGTAITLEDGVYEYAVLLDEGTTVVPALSATATMAAYGATAVPTDAAAFVDYKATSTVLVTAEDGATTQTYTVKFTVQHEYTEIEDVTGNTSWNWAGVADVTEGDGIVVDGSHGLVLANYIAAVNFEKLEAHVGARAYRSNSYPAYQGTSLKFHATVAGKLVINARRSSGSPLMKVNGAEIATLTSTLTEYVTFVPAGDVTITVTGNEMRIYAMEFQVLSEITPSYTRDNLNPANIGTLCWKNDGVLFGGTVYELTGKDENNKLVFDEVVGNVIKGGKPCIFVPENGNTEIKVYNTKNEDVDAGEFNGMKGTYSELTTIGTAEGEGELWNKYVISNNKYIYVDADNVSLKAYRAYITSLDDVAPASAPQQNSNGAPRRRIVMGAQGEQVATGFENLNASEKPVKLMIDGQIYILRGEKLYDATGRLVK